MLTDLEIYKQFAVKVETGTANAAERLLVVLWRQVSGAMQRIHKLEKDVEGLRKELDDARKQLAQNFQDQEIRESKFAYLEGNHIISFDPITNLPVISSKEKINLDVEKE